MVTLRILVTGASGLVGSKITKILVDKGHEVYSGYHKHKPLRGFPIKFDISNRDEVEKAFKVAKPEAVLHAAALTNVDECETKKELAWKINVVGTKNVAELSRRYDVFLIFVSTDYVFKGDKGMYKENDEPDPINYYGLTKLRGEEEVKELTNEYCIARSSVIYGSVPATGKVNFALWIIEKLRNEEQVRVVTDQWNSPTLNTNLAEMLSEVLDRRLTGIYHLAGATRISRYDFARLIAKTFDLNGDLIIPTTSDKIPWVARRPRDCSLDVSKASRMLHNKPLEIGDSLERLKMELSL